MAGRRTWRAFIGMLVPVMVLWAADAVRFLGKSYPTADPAVVVQSFARHYLRENGLEPTADELDRLRRRFPSPRPESRVGDWMVQLIATHFKLQRALYRKHGGRVALSAFGTHTAVDATAAELKLLEKQGKLGFTDAQAREAFYRAITEAPGDGVVKGEKAAAAFAVPPWEIVPER